MYKHIHACVLVCVHVCMHACLHVCMFVCALVCLLVSVQEPWPGLQKICICRDDTASPLEGN